MEEKKYTYKYPHPAVTADCVIFGFDGESLKILLIERGLEPYKGMWALPGGFMRMDETIEQTAARELNEETGLKNIYMEQFKVFSGVMRDPRERVVTVAFIALVRPKDFNLTAGDDASDARWFEEQFLPPMAFDHAEIIMSAREYLKEMLRIKPLAFKLLNEYFTMPELQRVYEAIEGRTYDRRNFQRKAMQTGVIKPALNMKISLCNSEMAESEPEEKSSMLSSLKKRFFSYSEPDEQVERKIDEGSVKDLFNFEW